MHAVVIQNGASKHGFIGVYKTRDVWACQKDYWNDVKYLKLAFENKLEL